jgi:hypothetical protein
MIKTIIELLNKISIWFCNFIAGLAFSLVVILLYDTHVRVHALQPVETMNLEPVTISLSLVVLVSFAVFFILSLVGVILTIINNRKDAKL